ncbi:MAG: hypothetical protein QM726_01385 [Chitinophagaceae bacterium]
MNKQPWIGRPFVDVVFILLPPFVSLLFIVLFPSLFQNNANMPDAGWIVLILLIDVAHVYSTLYRTYFDPQSFKKQKLILTAIPFIGFIIGVMTYAIGSGFFWRLLAYTAVFHFVRQQYGFMRVYGRKEQSFPTSRLLDKIIIYYATIYPLLYWHLNGPRNFNWFVNGDFFYGSAQGVLKIATILYYIVIALFLAKEFFVLVKTKYINLPKLGIIAGTLLSWYFGIVYYNGDMAFTLLNVVSHGIPYMALVWIYGEKNYSQPKKGSRFLRLVFSSYGLVIFLGLIFLFAFIEEGLWDAVVWQEHGNLFGTRHISSFSADDSLLTFIVPLLALPQITHYILDGFIWKIKKDNFKWNNEIVRP